MENKYSKILVAVDGSKQAEWAFTNAVAIALRNEDAELYSLLLLMRQSQLLVYQTHIFLTHSINVLKN